jgi:hypothetical protein
MPLLPSYKQQRDNFAIFAHAMADSMTICRGSWAKLNTAPTNCEARNVREEVIATVARFAVKCRMSVLHTFTILRDARIPTYPGACLKRKT